MPYIDYKGTGDQGMRDKTLRLINLANKVIDDWMSQGYRLTLRQLYYQLVAGGHIPNKVEEYSKLGRAVALGREVGRIDWNAIVDHLRELHGWATWESPESRMAEAAREYAIDRWEDQKYRPEVWVEKDALSEIVNKACAEWQVPFLVCRGYTSQTAIWEACQRMQDHVEQGYQPIIFHLGDHDPSGCHMTVDNDDRTHYFSAPYGEEKLEVPVKRIALNMDQVRVYNPPPNPAKQTDSRYKWYLKTTKQFKSWELDALPPSVLVDLISDNIKSVLDMKKYKRMVAAETAERGQLQVITKQYDSVAEFAELTSEQQELLLKAAPKWKQVAKLLNKKRKKKGK